jgi:hypothetical protein
MGNSTINARKRSITNAWMLFAHTCVHGREGLGCFARPRADFVGIDALLFERRFDQRELLPLLASKRDAQTGAAK